LKDYGREQYHIIENLPEMPETQEKSDKTPCPL